MELELTEDILLFDNRVSHQINALEKDVMGEIQGLQIELSKEEQRRVECD